MYCEIIHELKSASYDSIWKQNDEHMNASYCWLDSIIYLISLDLLQLRIGWILLGTARKEIIFFSPSFSFSSFSIPSQATKNGISIRNKMTLLLSFHWNEICLTISWFQHFFCGSKTFGAISIIWYYFVSDIDSFNIHNIENFSEIRPYAWCMWFAILTISYSI